MRHIVDRPFYSAYAWAYDLLITRPVSRGASKSLRRFFPICGAWSCRELLSSHGNHGYVAVERQSRFVPSLPKRPLCLRIVI